MSRRTRWVRVGQAGLLLVWLASCLRPVSGRRPELAVRDLPDSGYTCELIQFGDPLTWGSVLVIGDTSANLYPPDGRPGRPSVVQNPNRELKRVWGITDPFAPLPGLLLALALPPLLADRLTGPRRWNRWAVVATAAAVGGIATKLSHTLLVGVGADRGLIGLLLSNLRDAEPVVLVRHAVNGLGGPSGIHDSVRTFATLSGVVVAGAAAAGALRPWRKTTGGDS